MCNNFIFVCLIIHLAYPMLCKESFGVIWIMFSFTNIEAVNTISTSNLFWVWFCAFTIALFSQFFFLVFIGDRIIMFHDVDFLHVSVEIDGLTTLGFDAGVGFVFFVWPLWGVLLGLFLDYFTIFRGVSGAMRQACVSRISRLLTWRDSIFFLNFPVRPFSGLVGEADSPTFLFLKFLSQLESALIIF